MTAPISSAADLRARIRDCAAVESDPTQVAARVLASLSRPDEHRVIAETALLALVRVELAMAEAEDADAQDWATSLVMTGRRKWGTP